MGDAGIVFKRGDIKDLADKLQSLLSADDHLEKLREKSRTHLLAYTDQGMCDAYLAVMKAAVEGRKAIR